MADDAGERPGSARQEAERLVATLLAMAGGSGGGAAPHGRDDDTISGTTERIVDGLSTFGETVAGFVGNVVNPPAEPRTEIHHGWATGSVECCVCPICRVIANMRNPTPDAAERLATGAGDFASGVASLMRAFSAMSGSAPARPRTPAPPPERDPDINWSAATRAGVREPSNPDVDDSPWSAATRAAEREAAAERVKAAAARTEAAAKAAADAKAAAAAKRTAAPPTSTQSPGESPWSAAIRDERSAHGDAEEGSAVPDHEVADAGGARDVDHAE